MAVMVIVTNTQEAFYYFYPLNIVTEVYNSSLPSFWSAANFDFVLSNLLVFVLWSVFFSIYELHYLYVEKLYGRMFFHVL